MNPKTASTIPVHCSYSELSDVTKLVPNPKNPNKHGDKQVALLAKIIRHQGWRSPITVSQRSGFVVSGHGRLQAAFLLQVETVPVDYQEFATEADEWAHLVADNRIAELAEIDQTELSGLLKELDGQIDMDVTGFEADELAGLLDGDDDGSDVDGDSVPTNGEMLKAKWGVEPGQVWELGDHKILCGDSGDGDSVGRIINDGEATLIFTDPPYGVSIGSKNRMLEKFQKCGRNTTDIDSDDLSPEQLEPLLAKSFSLGKQKCADCASIFVCAPQGGSLGMMMMMMMEKSGLPIRHVLIWVKNSPTFSMGRLDYDYQHEPILFTWKKTHKRKKNGAFQTSIWNVNKPRSCADHPTMKPVELPVCAILNHSDQGDLVYEPFSGSGTTIMACEQTGRKCRAVEISPEYVAVAIERWHVATGKTPKKCE